MGLLSKKQNKIKTTEKETQNQNERIENAKQITVKYEVIEKLDNEKKITLKEKNVNTFEVESQNKLNEINKESNTKEIVIQRETENPVPQSDLMIDKEGKVRLIPQGNWDTSTNKNTQQLIIRDASAVVAEVLPPQMGSDPNYIAKGKYDIRRLTHLDDIDTLWISYFNLMDDFEGGEFAKAFSEQYMNLRKSLNGEGLKYIVKMQMAASGNAGTLTPPQDKRNWVERHITQRGKEPEKDDINEL